MKLEDEILQLKSKVKSLELLLQKERKGNEELLFEKMNQIEVLENRANGLTHLISQIPNSWEFKPRR
jgi:hypothetical protein